MEGGFRGAADLVTTAEYFFPKKGETEMDEKKKYFEEIETTEK